MLLNNRFRILKQLAKGGFGATYLAEDTHMLSRRHCVVKQLQPEVPNQSCYEIALKKFKEEAAVLEQLKHDQIPQLYGYFEQENRLFLIQEWVDGPTLGEKVRALGQLSAEEVQQMLLRVLPVLEYLQNFKVIHRDIKPDNLILRQADSRPVLIDFGSMKRHLKTRISFSGSVVDSVIIGTEGFMAPEQAAQRTVYASDLYSLGMTAIYALTAKLPVEMESDYDTGQFKWRQYAPHVSDHLANILDKATEFSPHDRFSTAAEMLDALTLQNASAAATLISERTIHERPTILDQVEPELAEPATVPTRQTLALSSSVVMTSLVAGGIGFAIALGFQGLGPQAVTANPDQTRDTGTPLVQAANTFSGQGQELGAIRTLLNVPTTSKHAQEAREKVANLVHLELGQPIDQQLDVINLEKPPGKAKRSLAGLGVSYLSEVDTKTQRDKVQTKFGHSPIQTYRSSWPIHRQPTDADLVADPKSWYDPWFEQYEIAPGMTMEVMYGCKSNKVLQTAETFDRNNVDDELIEARFNRILQGSRKQDIQVSQATLKKLVDNKGKARTETFSTDQVQGWIISNQDQLMIVTRGI
ncbi:serine/threonine-protein kinase [Acaryochloris sp. CCMEE 5410]|uniref:serine/threonine-protein kinase n=1 Tax=Acaryochloris sp. CCMEE 5410 TaxID=310037 RepID=UPI0002483F20|nr:serine/threonine-protein kinase [Acaryochloris sp. CCMEE 5410]KAI9133009.1 serine/threonine protein kinase [Acaryochloris sp. CCMEE 5410]